MTLQSLPSEFPYYEQNLIFFLISVVLDKKKIEKLS
jgi:hypothetical protein